MFQTIISPTSNTQQQLVDYLNAMLDVAGYVQGISFTDVPLLSSDPQWYRDFSMRYAVAKSNAYVWRSGLVPTMLSVPSIIATSDIAVRLEEGSLENALIALQQNPNDQVSYSTARLMLTQMEGDMGRFCDTVALLVQSLDDYGNNLQSDSDALQTGAQNALRQITVDQDKIDDLKDQIEHLQKEIKSLNDRFVIAGTGLGVSVTVAAVSAALIPATGGISAIGLAIGVAGIGGSIAAMVELQKKIKEDYAKIAEDNLEIGALNSDITQLQVIASTMDKLVSANAEARKALVTIHDTWTGYKGKLTQIIADLEKVGSEMSASEFNAALNDVRTAKGEWAALVEYSKSLANVQIQFSDIAPNIPQDGVPPQYVAAFSHVNAADPNNHYLSTNPTPPEGFTVGMSQFFVPAQQLNDSQPIYRFSKTDGDGHNRWIYSTSIAVQDNWQNVGEAFQAFDHKEINTTAIYEFVKVTDDGTQFQYRPEGTLEGWTQRGTPKFYAYI